MTKYQTPISIRRENRTLVGRFRGGKLAPVMAVAVRGSEGGMLSQRVTLELDAIAGRMITPITAELKAVFVPVQAIDAIKDPDAAYAGMTEVVREKLLSGNPLFGLEDEGEISKRCGVNPTSVGGAKKVSEAVRLAHNAAVNYMRLRKYDKAVQLLHSNTAITPALIARTVLDRLNGVLDPDDRINGAVQLQIPDMLLPVEGIAGSGSATPAAASNVRETGTGTKNYASAVGAGNPPFVVRTVGTGASVRPDVYAALNGAAAGNVSLTDFYNAETMDRLTRQMRQIVDDNPEYGEEMVLRWAHGLSVDSGRIPFMLADQTRTFGRNIVGATDTSGVEGEVMRSDMLVELDFVVPVPRTELGGIIVTFAVLKPDETLYAQPHPFLAQPWGLDNFVADELALDPVPVLVRELDSDCLVGDETTVSMYTGLNALKQAYTHYGLARQLDPLTVENKTALWQLKVPMSVTPETILYPADLDHYPFADSLAEVCTYTVMSSAVIRTPIIFGPTPVEELAVIGDNDLFGTEEP